VEIDERCRPFDADLSALIDGELGAGRRAEIEAHVASCAGCSHRLAALRAVDGALAALPSPAVAPDLRARLAGRLAAEPGPRSARPPPARSRRMLRAALPAAAAAALALYLALRAPAPPGEPPEPAAIAKAPPAAAVEPGPEPQIAETPPEAPAVEPAPSPAPQIAERTPEAAVEGELEALETEELGVVLDLDTIEDLPVIANLEVLERLLREEAG
jgi:hypothetical protein